MSARQSDLFEPRVADWLEDDPAVAPADLLATVVAALPNVPQRRRLFGPMRRVDLNWRLAAAALVVLGIGLASGILLRQPSVGPGPTPTLASLGTPVDAPLHFYAVRLPAGWTANLSESEATVDTYNGPTADITVRFVLIPPGVGQDEWADAYAVEQAGRAGPTCAGLDLAAFDVARIGGQDGLLYEMPCLPGWMALTAVGDRAYDIRLIASAPNASASDRAEFASFLAGVTFDESPTPTFALSTFISQRYGYSIQYPSGWVVTPANLALTATDTPWASGEAVDLIEGGGIAARGQPSSGTLDIASVELPPGTTLDAFTQVARATCGSSAQVEPVTVDGEVAQLNEFSACYQVFHRWVTVLHQGRGYHIVWLNDPGTEAFDRTVFEKLLATFRFMPIGP